MTVFNPSKESIRFIENDNNKISDGFWYAANAVIEAMFDGVGIRYQSPDDYKSGHPSNLIFAYYFWPEYRKTGVIGEITKEDIINCYEWMKLPITHDMSERTKKLCLFRDNNDPRKVKAEGDGVVTGLRLVLMSLRVQGLILLPIEFGLPTGAKWIPSSKYVDEFFTPLAKFFLSFHKNSPESDRLHANPAMIYYGNEPGGGRDKTNWFSSFGQSLCFAISANTAKELSIKDLVIMHYRNRAREKHTRKHLFPEFTASPYPWNLILEALFHEYAGQITFSVEAYNTLLVSYRNKKRHYASWVSRRKKAAESNSGDKRSLELPMGGREENVKSHRKINETSQLTRISGASPRTLKSTLFPCDIYSMDEESFYDHCLGLKTGPFSPKSIKDLFLISPWRVDTKAIDYWLKVITVWSSAKLKKHSAKDDKLQHIGIFFLYLFFYLPWWFNQNKSTTIQYPATANDLNPAIFGSRPIEPDYPAPKTFIEFINDRADKLKISDSTLYSYLDSHYNLFEWLSSRGGRYLEHANNFELFFDRDDMPKSRSRSTTTKNVFPRKLFKTVVSYAYGILEFYQHIQKKLEDGEITYDDLGHSGSVINTCDFGLSPLVYHLGKEYKIEKIPSVFLRINDLEYRDGRITNTIHLGPFIHNILALETGLRSRHILWLDETSFDSFVYDKTLNKEIYPLLVNTDKKGQEWTPFVSHRVIALLRDLREWKDSIADPIYHQAVDYTYKKTHYGKFHSIFAHNTNGRAGPFGEERYRDTWGAMCLGLQWFCSNNHITNMTFSKYLPTGAKRWKNRYKEDEVIVKNRDDESWTDGQFCPVSLRSYVTPHGARASVVSARITSLPADIIGKYITGQTQRVVFYYTKVTIEDINELNDIRKLQTFGTPTQHNRTNEADAVMLHCNSVNKKIAESVGDNKKLESTIDAFCLMSLDSLSDDNKLVRTGIEYLKNSKCSEIAYNESHICPFGNVCPKEIIEQYGESGLCGICSYSIKSIDHLPAINAAKHAALERLEGISKILERLCTNNAPDDEIYMAEQKRDNQAMDALGWELTEEILDRKRIDLMNSSQNNGKYVSFESEFVANYLEKVHVDNDETNYLICRLRECVEYPSLETPHISARFELAKRKLLAASGNLSAVFDMHPSEQPALELFSLISSMRTTKQISNADILRILRTDLNEMLESSARTGKIMEINNA